MPEVDRLAMISGHTTRGTGNAVAYARFAPDGQTIVTVSDSPHVQRWSREGEW